MSRGKFKGEFIYELMFFSTMANRDLKKLMKESEGTSTTEKEIIEKIEEDLITSASSFYGSRLNYDQYGAKKSCFIATYVEQLIKGKINEKEIDGLYDEIEEEEEKTRGNIL